MPQEHEVPLKCTDCARINYWTRKNKNSVEGKLELKKFCKQCAQHTKHKETSKKK